MPFCAKAAKTSLTFRCEGFHFPSALSLSHRIFDVVAKQVILVFRQCRSRTYGIRTPRVITFIANIIITIIRFLKSRFIHLDTEFLECFDKISRIIAKINEFFNSYWEWLSCKISASLSCVQDPLRRLQASGYAYRLKLSSIRSIIDKPMKLCVFANHIHIHIHIHTHTYLALVRAFLVIRNLCWSI